MIASKQARDAMQANAEVTIEQAAIIAGARGGRGPNAEYLYNTVAHLAEMGIPDPALETLAAQVRAIEGGRCP